ncbi:hypothetical protein [Marinilactibacillus psychrotolerans]|uniref:Uncharacterized protein n=1 Tax=Marinilactibacillus psychrotolerans TaxID=191770 RepID=A0AAV3WTS9_9LACT|nr:hypothetical protein [Marinilactibacillus psychrotolerans]GEL66564.1 hypothetical protein MPS01_07190 [Marinilactibacillus psychrotolerans]GEQ35086.1 hypothetical protein M132T_05940 [Marinilactibacillus psychrotolerans]SDD21826.1 hypothetical protein SAMN04488013_12124 [Marinilactibacillus psychrotolerans]
MEFNFISIVLSFIVLYLLSALTKLEQQVKKLNYTVSQLAAQSTITNDSLNNELRQLLKADKNVTAVKRVRESLGLSLIEANIYRHTKS